MKLRLEKVCALIRRDLGTSFESQGQLSLKQLFSRGEGGREPHPTQGGWLCPEAFLVVTVGSLLLASGVEARGADKHPARHRQPLHNKELLGSKVQ